MAKWSGKVGFGFSKEMVPGVWTDSITERKYVGDMIRNSSRNQSGNNLNDDIHIMNKISIISDPYAELNMQAIRYVTVKGQKWKVSDVEVQRPRLILSMGDVYTE